MAIIPMPFFVSNLTLFVSSFPGATFPARFPAPSPNSPHLVPTFSVFPSQCTSDWFQLCARLSPTSGPLQWLYPVLEGSLHHTPFLSPSQLLKPIGNPVMYSQSTWYSMVCFLNCLELFNVHCSWWIFSPWGQGPCFAQSLANYPADVYWLIDDAPVLPNLKYENNFSFSLHSSLASSIYFFFVYHHTLEHLEREDVLVFAPWSW